MRRALAALLLLSCGGGPPTFSRVQKEVFVSCTFAACHVGPGAANLNLEAPAYAKIVNVRTHDFDGGTLVVPGNPDASYLYMKISLPTPPLGARMPNTGEP